MEELMVKKPTADHRDDLIHKERRQNLSVFSLQPLFVLQEEAISSVQMFCSFNGLGKHSRKMGTWTQIGSVLFSPLPAVQKW